MPKEKGKERARTGAGKEKEERLPGKDAEEAGTRTGTGGKPTRRRQTGRTAKEERRTQRRQTSEVRGCWHFAVHFSGG